MEDYTMDLYILNHDDYTEPSHTAMEMQVQSTAIEYYAMDLYIINHDDYTEPSHTATEMQVFRAAQPEAIEHQLPRKPDRSGF